MPKPALGKVAVGDELLVIPTTYSRNRTEPVEATVAKVGRVWIELEETNQVRSFKRKWRLRLDTQDDGTSGIYRDRFVTREQYAWAQRHSAAYDYLREQGIDLRNDSPWRSEEQQLVLANLLRRHAGLPEL